MSSNSRSYGGRGGRGTGRGQGRNNRRSGNASKSKRTLQEHIFHIGSAAHACDYVTVRDFLINHIKKTYVNGKDIAGAIEKEKEPNVRDWRPHRERSVATDPQVQKMEDEDLHDEYKLEMQAYIKRKTNFEDNKVKAFALFFGQCSNSMQDKITQRKNYESEIEDDPIKLIGVIKEIAMGFQINKYPMASLLSSLKAFVNLRQKDGESLTEYTKRFTASTDLLDTQFGGSMVLTKYVSQLPGYDPDDEVKTQTMVDESFEKFLAYAYIENADRSKYGSFQQGLASQYSLHNDQYPSTMDEAIEALSAHRHDKKPATEKKEKETKEETTEKDSF